MQFTKENAYALVNELRENGHNDGSAWDTLLNEIEARDMFAKPRKPGSGRKDELTKERIVNILRMADADNGLTTKGSGVSRNYLERLTEKGYLEKQAIETGGRGRKPIKYVLTGRGRGYLALSKNWGME